MFSAALVGPKPRAPPAGATDHRLPQRRVPIAPAITPAPATRYERRTGSTPERRRFEPYRAASPREPVRRRSFHKCFRPPVAPTPGGRVRRSFSRQMASQQLRRAPVAPATRHERRTGSTPERNAIRALSSGLATIARADPRRASCCSFLRLMAPQRRVPIAPAITPATRHGCRTASTPERKAILRTLWNGLCCQSVARRFFLRGVH